jgi:hypothetical protein
LPSAIPNRKIKLFFSLDDAMSKKLKVVGSLFLVLTAFCFGVNFHIFHLTSWPLLSLLPSYFLNPLSLLIPKIVGHIPLISGALAFALTYIFASLWSIGLGALGVVCLRHKSKPKFPVTL